MQRVTQKKSRLSKASPDTMIGQRLDDYLLTRVLGVGGMGAVFEAVHEQIGRRVALKVLWNDLADDSKVRERFRGEAQAANHVEHPNIVEITDLREAADGTLYLVMELLHGESLRKRLDQSPQGIGQKAALRVGHKCALALSAAHKKGIVHRDFKPENVMLIPSSDGEKVKVLDFGVAKILYDSQKEDLTNPFLSAFLGTLEYAAPEQFGDPKATEASAARSDVGPAADVFAFAVTLCELLCGKRPFGGFAMLLHLDTPPEPSLPQNISAPLTALLGRMLARDPRVRPTMDEIATTLEAELRALEPPPPRTATPRIYSFALAAAALVAFGGIAAVYFLRAPNVASAGAYVPEALTLLRDGVAEKDANLRRAAVAAIGKSGRGDLAPLLVPLLEDPDARVGELAALGLQHLPSPAPTTTMAAALKRRAEAQPVDLRNVESAAALDRLNSQEGRPLLEGFLTSAAVRYRAALRLCEHGHVSGCDALRSDLTRAGLRAEQELEALYTVAAASDAAAGESLRQKLKSPPDRRTQLFIAGYLARLRGPWTDEAIRTLAEAAKARDFEAAVLAAKVFNPAGRETLLVHLQDRSKSAAVRMTAATALADQGHLFEVLPALAAGVRDAQDRRDVRLATASALLRLAGPGDAEDLDKICALDPQAIACLVLDSDRPLASETVQRYVLGYGDLATQERFFISRALGKRRTRDAVAILLRALEDRDYVVSGEALRSLRSVLAALRSRGDTSADGSIAALSQRLIDSRNPFDQVIGLSLRTHDAAAQARLLTMLTSHAQLAVRALIVELAERTTDSKLLVAGLNDAATEVRFAAARRLAEAGSNLAVSVLRQMLALADGSSLLAYALLHKLGHSDEAMARIDWVRVLNSEQRLWTRFEAVARLNELPPEQALPLLWSSLRDPAAVVRHRVAETAMVLYRKDPRPVVKERVRELLTVLTTDEEPYVHALAVQLLRELGPAGTSGKASKEKEIEKAAKRADVNAPVSGNTALTPPTTSTPVDSDVTRAAPERPAAHAHKSPGASRSTGSAAKQPPRPTDTAIVAQALEEVRRDEKAGKLIAAMHALQRVQSRQQSTQQREELQRFYDRLRKELAAYRIQTRKNGACVLRERVWQKPGRHMISDLDGQEIDKVLEAGREYVCDFCAGVGSRSCKPVP